MSHLFGLNTPKGNANDPAADLLRLNIIRGTKTASSTPERYDEYPRPFYMEVPPWDVTADEAERNDR